MKLQSQPDIGNAGGGALAIEIEAAAVAPAVMALRLQDDGRGAAAAHSFHDPQVEGRGHQQLDLRRPGPKPRMDPVTGNVLGRDRPPVAGQVLETQAVGLDGEEPAPAPAGGGQFTQVLLQRLAAGEDQPRPGRSASMAATAATISRRSSRGRATRPGGYRSRRSAASSRPGARRWRKRRCSAPRPGPTRRSH